MPTFIYQAKNEKGQIVSGTVEAENERAATQALWENRLKVIVLEPKPVVPALSFLSRVKVPDKAIFARQLSTMVSAGIHLPSALNVCLTQSRNRRLKEILQEVINDVEGGYSLSSALAKHPDAFDRVFISVVRAGETTGRLDQALLSLADRLEKDASFRGKVRSALIYPIFIFTVLICVGALMMVKVVPQLEQIFKESNVSLPWATNALIWTSRFLITGWWAILVGIVLIIAGVRFYVKTEKGMNWWNNIKIRFPVLGEINKNIIMARFTRTFTLLVRTGIPILDALHALADVMDNEVYRRAIYKISSEVERGVPLSIPISQDKNFPPIIGQMVAVGEKSGALDQILDKLGIFYENSVDEKTKTMGSLIEPIVIVILGVGVGILVFAILMPIYQIAQLQ